MQRVIAYVDGFNLYFGLRSKAWKRYYWLNIQTLITDLLKPGQRLVETKYFTSRVSGTPSDPDKCKRQSTYLEALSTLRAFSVFYGHYLEKTATCLRCGACWRVHEEKMTDVNIAVELVVDAFADSFDTALLVSGDSDLTAPVETVRRRFPRKAVIVGFPPGRTSKRLERAATAAFVIGRKKLADSQFPDQVVKADGYILQKPQKWI